MRLDANKGPYCFVPQNPRFQDYGFHSELYYVYSAEWRGRELLRIADAEPEFALVAKCLLSMGLFDDCAEMLIWRSFYNGLGKNNSERKATRQIVDAIDHEENPEIIYKELYFSFVLPIVAAVDMEQIELANCMYAKRMIQLERNWF